MSSVLLTNDDGVDSPALVPFARALSSVHPVTVVVPDGERSWAGKAVSRHEPITLGSVYRDGLAVHTTSGTPADAAQLGLHQVAADVDLVVSGINLGFNHGTAFLLSSGTVGAAVEGWIAGRPAIAFSTGTWGGDWSAWHQGVHAPAARAGWRDLAGLCTELLDAILDSGLLGLADIVSVNVPFDADRATPRRVTELARVGYGGLFDHDGDGRWRHQTVDLQPWGDLTGTDIEAAGEHVVTITPVRMPTSPAVPAALRARLEGS